MPIRVDRSQEGRYLRAKSTSCRSISSRVTGRSISGLRSPFAPYGAQRTTLAIDARVAANTGRFGNGSLRRLAISAPCDTAPKNRCNEAESAARNEPVPETDEPPPQPGPVEINRAEMIGQIEFALSGLSGRNGHHLFEELSFHLAQARIAPNLLPATGPVSSGGDQSRDFESFHSYLRETLGESGWFAGQVSEGALAFVCTLQAGSVAGKIKNDVTGIMSAGSPVDRIYAFYGLEMAVGPRHKLTDEVREAHGVELEVFDAKAIANHLASHDTFWIARQYLSLPAYLAPPPPVEPDQVPQWYAQTLDRWRQAPPRPVLAELLDIRDGLRHAASNPEARGDVGFWAERMASLAEADCPRDIRQLARYETAVASIRASGDLHPCDKLVADHLDEAVTDGETVELQDAVTLLQFATSAATAGHSHLTVEQLLGWREGLRARIAGLLAKNPPPGSYARLLLTKGHLALILDLERLELDPDRPRRAPRPWADEDTYDMAPTDVVEVYGPEAVADAFAAWSDLAERLDRTPLFPISEFARIWRFLTPLLADQPGWADMTAAVDAAVARSHGGSEAGTACRDRANALLEAGKLRLALGEFHRAKAEWWSGDSLRGALLSMLMLSQVYEELGMRFAAKQYALGAGGAAASSGDHDLADLSAAGFLRAAEVSYRAGDWASAIEELRVGLIALHLFGDEQDPLAQDLMGRAIAVFGFCLRGARELLPAVLDRLEPVGEEFDLLDDLNQMLDEVEPMGADEWRTACDRDIAGLPFSDCGASYEVRFAALGTRWRIHCVNRYREVRAVQRLAAAAQILLVELAEEDLCLLPSDLDVEVRFNESGESDLEQRPSGERREWRVYLTMFEPGNALDPQKIFQELLTTLSHLLLDISLLEHACYFQAVERAFERGLGHKLAAGRPYDEMAEIVSLEDFNASDRTSLEPPLGRRTEPEPEHEELRWQDGPGPTYSSEKATEMAANRYEHFENTIPNTLRRLAEHEPFLTLVRKLRAEGWLDWHLLTAVWNIVFNARLEKRGLNTFGAVRSPAGRAASKALAHEPDDREDEMVPLAAFDREAMERSRWMAVPSLLTNWDLHPRAGVPDRAATIKLLTERYAYSTSDAPHHDPFPNS